MPVQKTQPTAPIPSLRRLIAAAALAGTSLAASASGAEAATFTVDDQGDGPADATHCAATADGTGDCSLRDAIAAANDTSANPGLDTVTFDSSVTGSIGLTAGQLIPTEEISIQGPGDDVLAIDAQKNSRIFRFAGIGATFRYLGPRTDRGRGEPRSRWRNLRQ